MLAGEKPLRLTNQQNYTIVFWQGSCVITSTYFRFNARKLSI